MKLILVLGGARSGKSRYAQELASSLSGPVLLVATAVPGDEEMRQRIEEHRRGRPPSWHTLEIEAGVGEALEREGRGAGVVLLDCLTLLVANALGEGGKAGEERVERELQGLLGALDRLPATFIVVSDEVGMGLVPDNPLGRQYRDLLGRANQLLAQRADQVYLLVAGVPLRLK